MALSLSQKVIAYLKQNHGNAFTAQQIAEWVFNEYPEDREEKRARSQKQLNDKGLLQAFASEIGARFMPIQKMEPRIQITSDSPRRYYYSGSASAGEVAETNRQLVHLSPQRIVSGSKVVRDKKEHSLYPKLAKFLWAKYRLYPKRIDETRNKNKRVSGGNKWLYPDLVAVENLMANWKNSHIQSCVNAYADKKAKFWSFEVKSSLTLSTVREAFFQAVSNSTWANYGYLVSADLADNCYRELRILSALHGIGFIDLNSKNPVESNIMIPAIERSDIDWDTADRLAEASKDFDEFLDKVTQPERIYKSDSFWDIPQ